jgi:hypothetical protein
VTKLFRTKDWLTAAQLSRAWSAELAKDEPRANGHKHDLLHMLLEDIVNGRLDASGPLRDASEKVWLELLQTYLPQRYQAAKAHVVDSNGVFSDQIDVVIFDRQYSPFIFHYQDQTIIPAESVYAVFEANQSINADYVGYAQKKVASVRRLHRTSLPIPYARGTYPPKPLIPILGGILTFESDWSPAFGKAFNDALNGGDANDGRLNFGCGPRAFQLQSGYQRLRRGRRWKAGHGVPVQADLAAPVQRHGAHD